MDILIRWVHIVAAAVAVGGLIYARLVETPALDVLSDESRSDLRQQLATRLRAIALTVIVLAVVSGSYNFYIKLVAGVDPAYHMAFGIKFLLALHVFAMLFLLSTPPSGDPAKDSKRSRWMTGAIISGLVVVALGAYLRSLQL